jgi:hypothetical protein
MWLALYALARRVSGASIVTLAGDVPCVARADIEVCCETGALDGGGGSYDVWRGGQPVAFNVDFDTAASWLERES